MDIADPRVHPALVPAGSRPVVIAEHQDAYRDLPSIRTPGGQVITRWTPSQTERRAILLGEDIYVTILTTPPAPGRISTINPIFVTVGPVDWKAHE